MGMRKIRRGRPALQWRGSPSRLGNETHTDKGRGRLACVQGLMRPALQRRGSCWGWCKAREQRWWGTLNYRRRGASE
eukprot:6375228-Prorocentrum_lima.AAC.1